MKKEEMAKLASQVPAILAESQRHLTKISARNVELTQENADLRHALRLHKLAHRMEERGLEQGLDFHKKVAALQDLDKTKLAALEAAVELTPGGFKLGSLEESESANDGVVQGGKPAHQALDDFIMSGRALS